MTSVLMEAVHVIPMQHAQTLTEILLASVTKDTWETATVALVKESCTFLFSSFGKFLWL